MSDVVPWGQCCGRHQFGEILQTCESRLTRLFLLMTKGSLSGGLYFCAWFGCYLPGEEFLGW